MSVSAEALRIHLDYTDWASKHLVTAAGQLSSEELTRDFGTADKSVLGTLVHVFAADRLWLARIHGEAPAAFITDADYRLAVLENDWPPLLGRWKKWAGGLTDESAAAMVSYADLSGNRWQQPLWQIVLHVVNHGTHHRGQVSGFLRTMGHTPPKLDMTWYHRERYAQLKSARYCMQDLAFWKAVIVDESSALETIIALLDRNHVRYCVIDGQGVNAYVEPLVSLDLDLVVAAEQIEPMESLLRGDFKVERFPHSLNVSTPRSKLRVQIQTDPRYASFLDRAQPREILGLALPVASLEDILQGKIWAAHDPQRRPSKRRKDLLDIERIVEAYPELRAQVPAEILDRLAQP